MDAAGDADVSKAMDLQTYGTKSSNPAILNGLNSDPYKDVRLSDGNLHTSPWTRPRTYTDPTGHRAGSGRGDRAGSGKGGRAHYPLTPRLRYDSGCSVTEVTQINSCQNIFIAPTRDDKPEPEGPTGGSEGSFVAPDGGYGWVIVAAAFMSAYSLGLMFVGFSVLYVAIEEYFEADKGPVGLVGSLYFCTGNLLGFLFSPLIQRYGCRRLCIAGTLLVFSGLVLSAFATSVPFLYVSYGIIAGIGNGLVLLSFIVIVQQYFSKKRALAHALSSCGLSFGGMTAGPLTRWLLEVFGLRGTFIMFAGIQLHNVIIGALYRPLPVGDKRKLSNITKDVPKPLSVTCDDEGGTDDPTSLPVTCDDEDGTDDATSLPVTFDDGGSDNAGKCAAAQRFLREAFDVSLLRDSRSVLMYAGSFCMQFGATMMYSQTYGRALFIGIEQHHAALLVSLVSLSSLTGRGLCALTGLFVTRRTLLYAGSLASMSVGVMCVPLTTDFLSMTLIIIVTCICGGFVLSLQTPVLVDLFGVERIARAQAFQNMASGVGILCAVPFSGFLFDVTQSYLSPYLVCGAIELLSAIITMALDISSRTKRTKHPPDEPAVDKTAA